MAPPRMGGVARVLLPLVLLIALAGMAAFMMAGAPDDGWHDDLYEALDAAEVAEKPVFVLFTADWCPPCRTLKANVLSHPDVTAMLDAQFVLAKIDFTEATPENNILAAELGVPTIPAMHVYDAQGNRLGVLKGLCTPSELIGWLRDTRRD
ncbi:MAG: thioredoxin fold domain-containing protein [Planctomycetes bacterium]|nr:thioredoxin fold domain-containing protein [Planctomycetota bacterium]